MVITSYLIICTILYFHWRPVEFKCTIDIRFGTYGRRDQRPYEKADVGAKVYIYDYRSDHLTPACAIGQAKKKSMNEIPVLRIYHSMSP